MLRVHIFLLILYQLCVLDLCKGRLQAFKRVLFYFLLRRGKPMILRVVFVPRPYHGSHLVSHRHASTFVFLRHALIENPMCPRSVRGVFPSLTVTHFNPCLRTRKQEALLSESRHALHVYLSRSRRTLYQVLMERVTSDPLCWRLSSACRRANSAIFTS